MGRFEDLKAKYAPMVQAIEGFGPSIKVANFHVQDDKLFLRAAAASVAVKNKVWDVIKAVDPTAGDLIADITIDESLPPPPQTYTVQAGDTLSKISKQFYGDANKYMKIFEANRDQLSDPDKIKVGQTLTIPV